MTRYAKHTSTRQTPQSHPASAKQRKNRAGGFAFVLEPWAALDRWLVLGADGGTYYATERAMVRDNAKTVDACLALDGPRTVARIAEISQCGRAPKNDPAIFALAMAAAHQEPAVRQAALEALPQVCRTGTHLFGFVDAVQQFRGWGRALRRAIGRWYTGQPADRLAYQAVKYASRKIGGNTLTHRDVLRLGGGTIGPRSMQTDAVLRYIVAGYGGMGSRTLQRRDDGPGQYPAIDPAHLPAIIHGWEAMKRASSPNEAVRLIAEYGLTHEMVLGEFKTDPSVWAALLPRMPATALLRNLGNLGKVGVLTPMSKASQLVAGKLSDRGWLREARVHPLAILVALHTYRSGRGVRGSGSWTPVATIIDALDDAFYGAFEHVEPTGKNRLVALDVSGSMGWGTLSGLPGITPRVGSAAMCMTTLRSEQNTHVVAFTSGQGGLSTVNLSPRMRLDDVVGKVSRLPMGGTDCAKPMIWATQNKVPIDAFEVYTDNETWAGNIHPHQALEQYRQVMGRAAKLTVVGMTATEFSIANPDDGGMLDVVGFDTAAPKVMADFIRDG